MRRGIRSGVAAIALTAAYAPAALAAEPTSADRALAEALFRQGRELMTSGNLAEACPKLNESWRLDPAVGTLLNVATCHEQQGRIASAWIEFTDAAAEAKRTNQPEREALARRKAASLEPRLAFLTFDVAPALVATPDVEVRFDGALLGRAAWGTAMPIDPGEHRVEVSAPGKKKRLASVVIPDGARRERVALAPLDDTPSLIAPAPAPALAASASPRDEDRARGDGQGQRVAGFVTGGVGVVGLAVGAIFGARALSAKGDRDKGCDASGACSTAASVQADRDARSAATVATIATIAGAALVAGGLALVLTAPRAGKPGVTARVSPEVDADPSGGLRAARLVIGGSF